MRCAIKLALVVAAITVTGCSASPSGAGEGEGGGAEGEGGAAGEGEGVAGEGEGEGGAGVIVEPGDPGPSDVQLAIRTDTDRRPISPFIYGINGGFDTVVDKPTLVRSGGNRLTAYNWENNASNAGSDYCFQNDSTFGGDGSPPMNAVLELLDDAQARGTAALITVPIVDFVAKDHDDLGDGGQGPPACVGDVANSGADFLQTRFVANHARKGAAFADPPDLADDAVFEDEAVAYVKARYPSVPLFVNLDNEPDLWAFTHARIHPDPVSYAELVDRDTEFAAAVKDAAPDAVVFGCVSYGYYGYITLQDAPDAVQDGEFIPFFLDEMRAADDAAGRRLVDVLDLHWYPEARDANGVRVSDVEDATAADARVQAPRSLWDPSYIESSFIHDFLNGPVQLLPTLFAEIDQHDPGIKLSFSEWNYGGGQDISGALAVADVLGVFGREGVFAATFFPLTGNEPFDEAGLRVFTNYDDAAAHFGATSVSATSSDLDRVTVYASDNPLVVIAINKSATAIDAGLTLAAPATTQLRALVLDGSAPTIRAASGLAATATNAFHVTLPPSSLTILAPP